MEFEKNASRLPQSLATTAVMLTFRGIASFATVSLAGGYEAFLIYYQAPQDALNTAFLGMAVGALPLSAPIWFPLLWNGTDETPKTASPLRSRLFAVLLIALCGLFAFGWMFDEFKEGQFHDYGPLFKLGAAIGVAIGSIWWLVELIERAKLPEK